jgi:pimeloyl-ACP methyl ester carboxylesterase
MEPTKPFTTDKALVLVQGPHFWPEIMQGLAEKLGELPVIKLDLPDGSIQEQAKLLCASTAHVKQVWALGHGEGGAVITQALGHCHRRLAGLIYLAATIPFPGEGAIDLLTQEEQQGQREILDRSQFMELAAPDLKPARRSKVKGIMEGPIRSHQGALEYRQSRLEQIPKMVMITTEDRIVPSAAQVRYLERLEQKVKVNWINSGHLPQLTRESEVAETIKNFMEI